MKGKFGQYGNQHRKVLKEMTDTVRMICDKCKEDIYYKIEDSCPNCGLIIIECKKCKFSISFGE